MTHICPRIWLWLELWNCSGVLFSFWQVVLKLVAKVEYNCSFIGFPATPPLHTQVRKSFNNHRAPTGGNSLDLTSRSIPRGLIHHWGDPAQPPTFQKKIYLFSLSSARAVCLYMDLQRTFLYLSFQNHYKEGKAKCAPLCSPINSSEC